MKKDSLHQLSPVSVALHWAVALVFIVLLAMGKYMDIAEDYSIYPLHKSLGIFILALVIPRIIWRYRNGLPKPLYEHSLQEKIATIAHIALLVATLLMPISGMMMSGFGGHGLPLFGLELVAANPDPANPGSVLAINSTLASVGHSIHGGAQWLIIILLVGHVGAAIKHHAIDKDATLARMLGKKVH